MHASKHGPGPSLGERGLFPRSTWPRRDANTVRHRPRSATSTLQELLHKPLHVRRELLPWMWRSTLCSKSFGAANTSGATCASAAANAPSIASALYERRRLVARRMGNIVRSLHCLGARPSVGRVTRRRDPEPALPRGMVHGELRGDVLRSAWPSALTAAFARDSALALAATAGIAATAGVATASTAAACPGAVAATDVASTTGCATCSDLTASSTASTSCTTKLAASATSSSSPLPKLLQHVDMQLHRLSGV